MDYTGACADPCSECNGPTLADCTACVANASDDTGECVCDADWSLATNCSVYSGECNILCNENFGCPDGPGPDHCELCMANAEEVDGVC